jgi:hypothetical protein
MTVMNRFKLLPLLSMCAVRLSAALIDEIQVYTDDINTPGKFGLELHLNTTPSGRATPDYPGEIVPRHGLRLTPEFSYGVSRDFELGLYVPLHRTGGGRVDLPGAKLRLKWLPVQPTEKEGGWFAGINTEIAWLEQRFDAAHWGSEVRTIFGYRNPEWLLATNPVFEWTLAGADRSARPEFELQIKAARTIVRGLSFGPEYYAGLGPLGKIRPRGEQEHTLYAAFDVDAGPWVFNCGIGRGLTGATDRWTVKFIFEVPW